MANEKRLIDANAFRNSIKGWKLGKIPKGELLWDLDRQPTVDAVEVVHGRWIDEYPYVRCSECNAEWINCRTDNEPKLFYYCPNCGADMRERKDNERKAD